MARLKDGNLAQRTLRDAVNRHWLFAGGDNDRPPVPVREVQRLAEFHLAPALKNADPVTDDLVDHCAALLAHPGHGRGNSSDLLPLHLAVRGYRMLPEYIKLGVLRCLDGMIDTEAKMYETLNTDDDDVFDEMSARRTPAAVVVSGRKREQTYQTIHDGFEREGLDARVRDGGHSLRMYGLTNEYHRDMLRVSHDGGRYNDPELAARAVSALTGLPAYAAVFDADWPSLSEVTEWVREHEWDNVLTVGIRSLSNLLCATLNVMPGKPIPMTSGQVILIALRQLISDIVMKSGGGRRDDFQLTR